MKRYIICLIIALIINLGVMSKVITTNNKNIVKPNKIIKVIKIVNLKKNNKLNSKKINKKKSIKKSAIKKKPILKKEQSIVNEKIVFPKKIIKKELKKTKFAQVKKTLSKSKIAVKVPSVKIPKKITIPRPKIIKPLENIFKKEKLEIKLVKKIEKIIIPESKPLIPIKEIIPKEKKIKKIVETNITEPVEVPILVKENKFKEIENYKMKLASLIEQNKYYPKKARRFKREGDVKVRFILSPVGDLIEVTLVEKSKYRILDNAAKKTIKKIGRFPDPPIVGNERRRFVYEITIRFSHT